MGGKEGVRGYLYQAMAAVLQSIREDDWDRVCLEPVTKEDKVDIVFEYIDGSHKVIQVKSSIHNFIKSNICDWLKKMIIDVDGAKEYNLILIGTCSDTKTINCLNKLKDNIFDKETVEFYNTLDEELKEKKDKIKVKLLNNDMDSMEALIMVEFMRFLNNNGFSVDSGIIDLIVGAVTYQFNVFATKTQFISREDFKAKIIDWLNYCYGIEPLDRKKVDLKIQYYFKGLFEDKINNIKLNYKNLAFIEEKRTSLIELYRKIDSIKLPCAQKQKPEVTLESEDNILKKLIPNFHLTSQKYCEYDCELKQAIEELANKILEVPIEKDFFNVGNLQKDIGIPDLLTGISRERLIGTDIEKQKFEKLEDFFYELIVLGKLIEVIKFVCEYSMIPLVIRNIGGKYDEKIRVRIKLPKTINILTANNFINPDNIIIDMITGHDGQLESLLRQHNDSKVQEGPIGNYIPSPELLIGYLHEDKSREEKRLSAEFKKYLNCIFDLIIFDDDNDYKILEFNFDELKPNESIAFPCFVFFNYDTSFNIYYEITSKNSSNIQSGKLTYEM